MFLWDIVFTIIEETFFLLHLQFSVVHVRVLSNRIHRSQTVSNVSELPVGEETSYLSFLNRAQPAFCSQLTGLSAVFSWIVLMSARDNRKNLARCGMSYEFNRGYRLRSP